MGDLRITPDLIVPEAELEWRFSRAGGPGGQHVNTAATRAELRWDIAGSAVLDEAQRARLLERLAQRIDASGVVRLVADDRRSQRANRALAAARLADLVAEALAVPAERRPTRPSAAARAARLTAKRRRAAVKRERRGPPFDAEGSVDSG